MTLTIPTPRRTLLDAALPARTRLMDLVLILAGSGLMALAARLTIPLPWVPITAQTYALLLVSALLGGRRGALALIAYLVEGLIGLPVFAYGYSAWTTSSVGVPTIVGPSAGYLFSYPIVAAVVGTLAERGGDRIFWRAVATMAVGEVLIYLVALPWLAHFIGAARAVQFGLLPFVIGDIIKIVLAAATLPLGWRILGTYRRSDPA